MFRPYARVILPECLRLGGAWKGFWKTPVILWETFIRASSGSFLNTCNGEFMTCGRGFKKVCVWKLRWPDYLLSSQLQLTGFGKWLHDMTWTQWLFHLMVKIPKLCANASLDLYHMKYISWYLGSAVVSFPYRNISIYFPRIFPSFKDGSMLFSELLKLPILPASRRMAVVEEKNLYSIFRKTVNISSFLTKHTLLTL